MFVATANSLDTIQPALRDRMEIIEINGYTLEEKVKIAQKHLLPKQLKRHGLKKNDLVLSDSVLEKIIDQYTRESGVRLLEKRINKIIRHIAKSVVLKKSVYNKPNKKQIELMLGAPKYDRNHDVNNDVAGVVTGLAWTSLEVIFYLLNQF